MRIYLLAYLATISLFAVALTLRDKSAARKNGMRIKELTLLAVSAIGGSAAMFLAMLAVRHKTRRIKFMAGILLIMLLQIATVLAAFNQGLSVSRFSVETDMVDGEIKLVLVADLHSCDYGDGQKELLEAIDAAMPDAVLLCGDIFDDGLPPENAIEFTAGVTAKYPCYYVSGNHEYWSGRADVFKNILESYGVEVFEGTTCVLEVRGDRIRIGGIDDPDVDRYTSRSIPYAEQVEQLSALFNSDMYNVLLSHRPERIEELLPLQPGLVLSGHAHGGQWRMPLILGNGLFSPNQGFFPKYANGRHLFGETKLIVSRGLARETTTVPRLFNRPEIVVITVTRIKGV